ncbi:MAG: porphobilinogen synthase [Gammaproteobacteria bacterium]
MHHGQYPEVRLRRLRQSQALRDLCTETRLHVKNLIWPLFICEGHNIHEPIHSMPGVFRYSLDRALQELGEARALGLPAVALFPALPPAKKTAFAEAAFAKDALLPQAIAAIKQDFPDLALMVDVALDPYTSHGHDGILNAKGDVDNDATIELLKDQALIYAQAGADILAPSDMMDGRIGAIRQALENKGQHNALIMAYSAKYASKFYGPFREAVRSGAHLKGASKASYQMPVGNHREALRELALDVAEGADIVMIKPGMPYLDVVWHARQCLELPIAIYQVSGEYSMLKLALEAGVLQEEAVLEAALCMKRAGADMIITYFAKQIAGLLGV